MNDLSVAIGKRVLELRKNNTNLSQEALAFKAEIDRTYMTGIETGKRNVSVFVLSKIVKALDTDLPTFFNHEIFKN